MKCHKRTKDGWVNIRGSYRQRKMYKLRKCEGERDRETKCGTWLSIFSTIHSLCIHTLYMFSNTCLFNSHFTHLAGEDALAGPQLHARRQRGQRRGAHQHPRHPRPVPPRDLHRWVEAALWCREQRVQPLLSNRWVKALHCNSSAKKCVDI